MRYPSLAAQTTLGHDILKEILRRAVHRAGIASALEPPLRRLPGLADGAGIAADGSPLRSEARGDILMVLPRGITMSDISIIHPLSISTPSLGRDHCRGRSLSQGPTEADGVRKSGAQRLRLRPVLR
jgi:hypothetical protein